jgi:putative transposase
VEPAALQFGLGRSVLYHLLQRYRQRPQTSSLLPGKRGREAKASVLSQDREHLLNSCIQEFYLSPERPRLAALVLEVRRRFAEQSLPAPNYRTIRRPVAISPGQALALRSQSGSPKHIRLRSP